MDGEYDRLLGESLPRFPSLEEAGAVRFAYQQAALRKASTRLRMPSGKRKTAFHGLAWQTSSLVDALTSFHQRQAERENVMEREYDRLPRESLPAGWPIEEEASLEEAYQQDALRKASARLRKIGEAIRERLGMTVEELADALLPFLERPAIVARPATASKPDLDIPFGGMT